MLLTAASRWCPTPHLTPCFHLPGDFLLIFALHQFLWLYFSTVFNATRTHTHTNTQKRASSWPIENLMNCRGQSPAPHPQTLTLPTSLAGGIGLPIPILFDPITVAITHKANTIDHHDIDHLLQEHFTFLRKRI